MASASLKKRKFEDRVRDKLPRPKKRVRKQRAYHSSSEESEEEENGFTPVDLNDSEEENHTPAATLQKKPGVPVGEAQSEDSSASDAVEGDSSGDGEEEKDEFSDDAVAGGKKKKTLSKRNDPEAFSTSISKILSTKLSQSAKKDPVLSRSREAAEIGSNLANERLEQKAKAKLRNDRKIELERGRVKDVLGLSTGDAGETAEEEKRLRKIAQRGVVKLFNAVRAAQVRGEEAAKEERKKGTVGMANREVKVTEMSKQGFLELINGKKSKTSEEE